MNANTIRDALRFETNTLAESGHHGAAESLRSFRAHATDAELVRFAQLINNLADDSERLVAPAMDSADLARANLD